MSMQNTRIILYVSDPAYRKDADLLARLIHASVTESEEEARVWKTVLRYGPNGVSLLSDGMEMKGDFSSMHRRYREANLKSEMLIKAAGIYRMKQIPSGDPPRPPFAIDATAGMGEDSFLLAASGYRVQMFERDPVIAALLEDTVKRGKTDPEVASIVARMEVRKEDSIHALKKLKEKPDLILLDPMFPERQKSGLVKKKFQLLHLIEPPSIDGKELMEAARSVHPGKIIVKRPLKGPYLGNYNPSYSMKGRSIRYDVYL